MLSRLQLQRMEGEGVKYLCNRANDRHCQDKTCVHRKPHRVRCDEERGCYLWCSILRACAYRDKRERLLYRPVRCKGVKP